MYIRNCFLRKQLVSIYNAGADLFSVAYNCKKLVTVRALSARARVVFSRVKTSPGERLSAIIMFFLIKI